MNKNQYIRSLGIVMLSFILFSFCLVSAAEEGKNIVNESTQIVGASDHGTIIQLLNQRLKNNPQYNVLLKPVIDGFNKMSGLQFDENNRVCDHKGNLIFFKGFYNPEEFGIFHKNEMGDFSSVPQNQEVQKTGLFFLEHAQKKELIINNQILLDFNRMLNIINKKPELLVIDPTKQYPTLLEIQERSQLVIKDNNSSKGNWCYCELEGDIVLIKTKITFDLPGPYIIGAFTKEILTAKDKEGFLFSRHQQGVRLLNDKDLAKEKGSILSNATGTQETVNNSTMNEKPKKEELLTLKILGIGVVAVGVIGGTGLVITKNLNQSKK